DAMTAPVQSIELSQEAATMEAAQGAFVRFGYSVLPVTEQGKLVGMLSRRDVDKALHHGLGGEPITRYVGKPSAMAEPSASVSELQRLLANQSVDRVPIVHEGRLVGIVTRTDLLEALHKLQPLAAEADTLERLGVLPPLVQRLLRQGGEVGDQ